MPSIFSRGIILGACVGAVCAGSSPAQAAWGGWESLGGVIMEAPDCVSWGEDRIDCFARGTDNAMHHRWWDGASWGGWESLGGVIMDAPDCVSWGENRIDCFARGTDNAMHHRWWDGASWGGWESLGGVILEGPDCVSWGENRIDCFARGTDMAMHHRWWDGSSWGGWESLGGVILEEPDCVSWGENRIDCFARGTDSAMHHRWWDGSAWGGWESLGGVILEAPDCVSWGENRIDCFARGTDSAMHHRWWDGSAWGGWESLGGVVLDAPDCVSWASDRIDCFTPGTDNALYHRWWDGGAAAAQRKSINDLTEAELMSFRRGVAAMMARNTAPRDSADFRRSWVNWANMHAHFGADCGGPISGGGMAGVQVFTASNDAESATWCGCEHGNVRFLTWHRMYLWYFERVLQEAAGDTSLRLPYWDYATDPTLPAAYRDPTYVNENGQTVPNPLRVEARQAGLNAGSASLLPSVRSAAGAMGAANFQTFSGALEGTPHGAVHCAIVGGCPTGLMGSVPAAALDPIFYAHHTNIDRLYQCWLRSDEAARLPNDPGHLDTRYTFVDADGSLVERRVGDMLSLAQLGYSYAEGGDCPAATPALVVAAADIEELDVAQANDPILATSGPVSLERGVTTVPLSAPATAAESLTAFDAQDADQRAYVIIEGLAFDEAPGTLYDIFLEDEDGTRAQIGVINFFNATAPRTAEHGAHGDALAEQIFDATEALQRLGRDPGEPPRLVFEPTTGLSDSTPEVAAEAISPQANVRFDDARIVVGP